MFITYLAIPKANFPQGVCLSSHVKLFLLIFMCSFASLRGTAPQHAWPNSAGRQLYRSAKNS